MDTEIGFYVWVFLSFLTVCYWIHSKKRVAAYVKDLEDERDKLLIELRNDQQTSNIIKAVEPQLSNSRLMTDINIS
jgi:hypothetical protein